MYTINNFYNYNDIVTIKTLVSLKEKKLIDIYQIPEFIKLHTNTTERLFIFINQDKEKIFYLPIIVKKIKNNSDIFFFETLHGYSGPISNSNDTSFISGSWKKFYDKCKDFKIISGFIRFNPFLKNHLLADKINFIKVEKAKKIIYCKLNEKYFFYYSKYSKNVKKNLKDYKKNNFKIIESINIELIEKFSQLYLKVMKEKSSMKSYRYDVNYFNSLFKNHPDKTGLVSVQDPKDNSYLAGLLYLKFNDKVHVHLSCSTEKGKKYSAPYGMRNYLFHKFEKSSKIINFGGGLTSKKDDSLFLFKKGFADSFEDYFIGKVIINNDIHHKISKKFVLEKNNMYKDMHIPYRSE